MLSYQHEYHAGNHADVLKHSTLALLIGALQRKPKAIRVIDTHAGSGSYDLTSAPATLHREFDAGIAPVLQGSVIPELDAYVAVIRRLNPGGALRRYPGSPQIARMLLRPEDHVEMFELHPRAFQALSALFRDDRQAHVHRRDAFEGLVAVLPPPERRGIVLVDPSYETDREFDAVLHTLGEAVRRWPGGVYAIWYPLLDKPSATRFVTRLEALRLRRLFQVELTTAPAARGLKGSGVVVANLPYQLETALTEAVRWLHGRLAETGGAWKARWLTEP